MSQDSIDSVEQDRKARQNSETVGESEGFPVAYRRVGKVPVGGQLVRLTV